FYDNGAAIGTSVLDANGAASFATTLSTATHAITAAYTSGDDNYRASPTSAAVSQTVNPDPTTAAVASSVYASVFGQGVTFTATITANGPGAGMPTGTVTFYDNGTTFGTGTLVNGVAKVGFAGLPTGSDAITIAYSGDTNFVTSSTGLTQVVHPANTS